MSWVTMIKRKVKRKAAQPEPPTPFPDFGADPLARSTKLLLSHLNKAEREQYTTTGYVTIKGKSGLEYIFGSNGTKSVRNPKMGPQWGGLCIYIAPDTINGNYAWAPQPDQILGMILYIKTNEDYFRKVARVPPW